MNSYPPGAYPPGAGPIAITQSDRERDGNVAELRALAESLVILFKERDENGPTASINDWIVRRARKIADFVDRMEWRGPTGTERR